MLRRKNAPFLTFTSRSGKATPPGACLRSTQPEEPDAEPQLSEPTDSTVQPLLQPLIVSPSHHTHAQRQHRSEVSQSEAAPVVAARAQQLHPSITLRSREPEDVYDHPRPTKARRQSEKASSASSPQSSKPVTDSESCVFRPVPIRGAGYIPYSPRTTAERLALGVEDEDRRRQWQIERGPGLSTPGE